MAADERGSGQAYWRALAVSSALPCACMHARACACSARARHALHARTLEKLNGGWPGGRDGGGQPRLPQTAARCAAERWPCHLRCHARACTRARSARMRARKKRSGWHRTSTAAAARRAAERWTRHLRCNTRAIRVRMRVLCTSAHGWHARKNPTGPVAGSPIHAHPRLEDCPIHRTGSSHALRPLVSAASRREGAAAGV